MGIPSLSWLCRIMWQIEWNWLVFHILELMALEPLTFELGNHKKALGRGTCGNSME